MHVHLVRITRNVRRNEVVGSSRCERTGARDASASRAGFAQRRPRFSSAYAESMFSRAPATSANLGPGFDTLAVALSLYVEVTLELADRVPHLKRRMRGGAPRRREPPRRASGPWRSWPLELRPAREFLDPLVARFGVVGRAGGRRRRGGRLRRSSERGRHTRWPRRERGSVSARWLGRRARGGARAWSRARYHSMMRGALWWWCPTRSWPRATPVRRCPSASSLVTPCTT